MQTKLQNPNPQKANKSNQEPVVEKTFLEHVYELRSRAFWIVSTIILASALGFQIKDQLIAAVMAPLHGEKLVYLTPGGGFSFIFTLSIYFGVLLAIPVIVYHIYRFLQPLLKQSSRRMTVTFMSLSVMLAAGGAAFGYFVTIPAALDFLSTFAGDAVTPNLTAESYLNFVVAYVLGLALLFQLPLLLFLFDYVRPFPPGSLLSTQRFVIIGATIVAAIITPTPDMFNMAIVAVPIVAIYQFGVIAVFARHRVTRSRARQAKKLEAQVDTPAPQAASTFALEDFIEDEASLTEVEETLVAEVTEGVVVVEEAPVIAVPIVPRPQTGKSIDGFQPKNRSVPPALQVPSRQGQGSQQNNRQTRSIDGFWAPSVDTGKTLMVN